MNNKKNYLIIIIYGIILTLFLVRFNVYGSNVDWINQHTIIPEAFRSLFYETKNLIPNLIFNLGAGQNIFNYSYYGLMSPIILISYFLPFINMGTYIIISSFLLYLITGLLTYKFLLKDYSSKISLYSTIVFMSIAPLTYHFHHHIMFVSYYPFLILSLMGVRKYLLENKSLLLILSIFLLILTNYYYSVPSLIVITLYGIYELLKKENFQIKTFIINILKAFIRVLIPILLASFILLPTLYAVKNTNRLSIPVIDLASLFKFNLKETLYRAFNTGLSFIFISALFGNIISNKKNKGDIFLNSILIIISMFPIFSYILNGFLYVRGKVLIPFSILYLILFLKFLINLKEKNISLKKLFIIFLILGLYIFITNYDKDIYPFMLDALVAFISIYLFYKFKKEEIIFIPLVITMIICSYYYNKVEEYISISDYKTNYIDKKNITNTLLNTINDESYFRTQNYDNQYKTVNMYYNKNYYSTSIYSSNYNSYYWNFYNFNIGNNIENRNMFATSGSSNTLFYTLMGVKYIISANDIGLNYEKINSYKGLNLYYNKDAYPLVYITDKVGSINTYEKLKFPYNIEYMLNNPIVDSKTDNYKSIIKELDLNLNEEYIFNLDKKTKYTVKLNQPINNKYIMISFDMAYNATCDKGDVYISINGVKNKLTCKDWYYHNKNYNFQYVISSNEEIENLNITLSKGNYYIKNINIYEMDNIINKVEELSNLKINKKDSLITGTIDIIDNSYVITSFPYDSGYVVYVDNEKVEKMVVNTAFLGFKVNKGKHNIKIKYISPYYKEGIILSIFGLLGLVIIVIEEYFGGEK